MPDKYRIEMIVVAIIVFVVLVNLSLSTDTRKVLGDLFIKYEEKNKPTDLDILIIKDDDCPYCFNTDELIGEITTENVNIRSSRDLDYRNSEAQKLISKYKIGKIPAVIIKKDLNKNYDLFSKFKDFGEISDNVFIFKEPAMPYIDVSSGKAIGEVKVTLLAASNCDECYNHEKYIAELKILGISTLNREVIDYRSNAGQALVKQLAIEKVPTFILTGDLDRYPALKKIQDYDDNIFVLRNVIGPYMDLADGKVYTKSKDQ